MIYLKDRDTHDRRLVRRRDPLVVDIIKVDVSEEGVSFDCFSIVFTGAETTDRVPQ